MQSSTRFSSMSSVYPIYAPSITMFSTFRLPSSMAISVTGMGTTVTSSRSAPLLTRELLVKIMPPVFTFVRNFTIETSFITTS